MERSTTFFRSKAFSLVFGGGRVDSYAIHERRAKFHGVIRVGRVGLGWIITCLGALKHWNFSKQHSFKRLRESSKVLEITSRSNKGGLFVEIFEYHNGACCGCVWVPEGVKLGGWAVLESRLCGFFLGSFGSQPGKEVVAGGGGFEKSIGNQRSQVWKKLNGHNNIGSDSRYEKQFPNLAGVFN